MKIITISGVDGSGKSTQAKLLMSYLRDQGFKPYYFHATQFSIGNKLLGKSSTPGTQKSITKASWHKIQLRKFALLIDLLRFQILTRKLEHQNYTHIISDRYFFDTVVNIAYLSKDSINSLGLNMIISLIEPPDNAFYIDVDLQTIKIRDREIDQDDNYLSKKMELYKSRLETFSMQKIDGTPKEGVIQSQIRSIIDPQDN